MKQYVVIARDGTDADAMERRQRVRPLHVEGAAQLKQNGQFVLGGAMLSEEGHMTGSIMIVQFETEAAFQQWYQQEPYLQQGVWKQIEIQPFKVAHV
jgi:uncharacterized protein